MISRLCAPSRFPSDSRDRCRNGISRNRTSAPRTFIFLRTFNVGFVAVAWIALCLHSYFVRSFAHGGKSLPMAASWPNYFCVGNLIRAKYPGLAVVTRVADGFVLPIAAEFTTAMVWPQVAFVHQRVGDADAAIFGRIQRSFERNMLTRPQQTLDALLQLGFNGLVWGPIEENGWGPKVREALTSPAGFLGSCGRVFMRYPARTYRHDVMLTLCLTRRSASWSG